MAVQIEEVKITPNPIPPSGGTVRAECRVAADEPIEAVTAYPPEGPSIALRPVSETQYAATESVPPGTPPGTYDVVIVARAVSGTTARTVIAVTLQ